MLLERLISQIANRQPQRSDVSKKITIIREPAKEIDLRVELPAKPYNPNKPQLDPLTLPGELLPLFETQEFLPTRHVPKHVRFNMLG